MDTNEAFPPAPASLLRELIRFDTTNPPGNEAACIRYLAGLLQRAGIEPTLLAKDPNRPNLLARLPGQGRAAPLLLYGHVDVVTTAGQQWTHPPFAAEVHDGYIWGRGALDMKGEVALFVSALLRMQAQGIRPPGDLILAVVADEEAGGDFGAKFLVEQHPEWFTGVRYALGEFGGFSLNLSGQRFYPIMVAEKQPCWMRLHVHGPGGHASMPLRSGAMSRMAHVLTRLSNTSLPVHITPVARAMIAGIAAALPGLQRAALNLMLTPAFTDSMLRLMGTQAGLFAPLLHNTVSPTVIRGGEKINVHPSELSVDLDGRLLPGFTFDDMQRELRLVIGAGIEYELETQEYLQYPGQPDLSRLPALGGVLKELDPQGISIPLLLAGVTDGRFFARLGIQTYGFTPLRLPEGFNFVQTIHAADERVPVEALDFGVEAVLRAVQRI
jgi:acetylornithine deacetylase/succinyl-diaminopimelate desuccinylase-like protein